MALVHTLRNARWLVAGFSAVAGVVTVVASGAMIPHWADSAAATLTQRAASLHALDAFLMMGELNHVHLTLLAIIGVGLLTLTTLALLTPLALGFLVLDIHMELREVCDAQGKASHTERRLFCKLHRPTPSDDTPTRFIEYSS